MPLSHPPKPALATAILLVFLSGLTGPLAAQEPAQPPPPAEKETAPQTAQPPPAGEQPPPPAGGDEEGEEEPLKPPEDRFLPRLDVYFPEGDLDLRVSRLINKVFFEGQVKYNFIDGDISAFLRYRYYGYQRTTQFTVFDAIEFDDVQDFSSDFDRVRGTLLLMQWPHSYVRRTFVLLELDRISTNKEVVAEDIIRRGDTNTFVRLGYQIGTPEDERSNAIVGETRARSERLFTAFRDIGPGGFGFTGAVTAGFPGIGDFEYVKVEAETLKRFDISERTFVVGRLHAGTFLHETKLDLEDLPPEPVEEDEYDIPRSEYFRLDGRDYLKGVKERRRGIEQVHMTWEYFFPWFLNAEHDFLRLKWQNWYWILYVGAGNVGFDREIYTDFSSFIPDAGVGFESSFKLRKYRFFLSGIVAQALKGDGGVEARISVKSYR